MDQYKKHLDKITLPEEIEINKFLDQKLGNNFIAQYNLILQIQILAPSASLIGYWTASKGSLDVTRESCKKAISTVRPEEDIFADIGLDTLEDFGLAHGYWKYDDDSGHVQKRYKLREKIFGRASKIKNIDFLFLPMSSNDWAEPANEFLDWLYLDDTRPQSLASPREDEIYYNRIKNAREDFKEFIYMLAKYNKKIYPVMWKGKAVFEDLKRDISINVEYNPENIKNEVLVVSDSHEDKEELEKVVKYFSDRNIMSHLWVYMRETPEVSRSYHIYPSEVVDKKARDFCMYIGSLGDVSTGKEIRLEFNSKVPINKELLENLQTISESTDRRIHIPGSDFHYLHLGKLKIDIVMENNKNIFSEMRTVWNYEKRGREYFAKSVVASPEIDGRFTIDNLKDKEQEMLNTFLYSMRRFYDFNLV